MKRSLKVIVVISFALAFVYICLPYYAQRAIIYTNVGIDDYPIFDNRIIEKGNGQPWMLDSQSIQSLEINKSDLDSIESLDPITFLLIKDQKIIFEKYWANYNEKSLSNSFSMAKSIVSLLIGAAIDDGFIKSVNDPVAKYINAFKKVEDNNFNIQNVLTMSSGLDWSESYGSLFNTTTEAYYGDELKEMINKLNLVDTPGKKFKYLSGDTQLLAMIVEEATGLKLAEYASKKFWKGMNAENDALWCLDHKDGIEKAYCCFNSNARDFARWGQLILNNGIWNGDTLISANYLRDATRPAQHLKDESGNPVDFYGYQWWIHHTNGWTVPYMRGILGQYVFAIPSENAVLVRLGRRRSDEKVNHHPKDSYLYLKVAKNLLDQYKKEHRLK